MNLDLSLYSRDILGELLPSNYWMYDFFTLFLGVLIVIILILAIVSLLFIGRRWK